MKTRSGFVSNSSSSSFIVNTLGLDVQVISDMLCHSDLDECGEYDIWSSEPLYGGKAYRFSTNMDNFDLHSYITDVLGVPEDSITDYGE